MKAIRYTEYGPPDVLQLTEVATPVPTDDEILIRIRAASVNPLDWRLMRGKPYPIRMMTGLRRPKETRVGHDLAGQVGAVGGNVTQFQPGDAVFGAKAGAFAEYVCASESDVVPMPDNLTFEQAAAVAVAGLTALQGLRDRGRIQPGQKVLINGAAGMLARQLAFPGRPISRGPLPWGLSRWLPSCVDLIHYGVSNVSNLTRTLVDPLLEFVRGGIAGAIIAAVLARIAKPEFRAQART